MFASKAGAAAGSGFDPGYQLPGSVALGAGKFFSRTWTAANRKTFTLQISCRIIKLTSGSYHTFFGDTAGHSSCAILGTTGKIHFSLTSSGGYNYISEDEFRDGGHYTFIIRVDTTQAAQADRVRIYVMDRDRGRLITWATDPAIPQNTDTYFWQALQYNIGRWSADTHGISGPVSYIAYFDGQSYGPDDLWGQDENGVDRHKDLKNAGLTWGTEGDLWDMSDTADLGNGVINGKDLTANSITSSDASLDTPSDPYPVLDIRHPITDGADILEDGCQYTHSASSYASSVASMPIPTTGKWGFLFKITGTLSGSNELSIGVATSEHGNADELTSANMSTTPPAHTQIFFEYMGSVAQRDWNYKFSGGSNTSHYDAGTMATGDEFEWLFDMDAQTLDIKKNGVAFGTQLTGVPNDQHLWPYVQAYATGGYFDFGQRGYTPSEAGYQNLKLNNLPEPAIKNGREHVDVLTYVGDATNPHDVQGALFQPDSLEHKLRIGSQHWFAQDALRGFGASKSLCFSSSGQQGYNGGPSTHVLSALTDGFRIAHTGAEMNANGASYLMRLFNMGGNSVSNSDGTITAMQRANPDAGMSISIFQGNDTDNATVGHGLNGQPNLTIIKPYDVADNWVLQHSYDYTKKLKLNANDAESDGSAFIKTPTSTLITLGTDANVNSSSRNYLMQCFQDIPGFSKHGYWDGNDMYVYTGFTPHAIDLKNVGSAVAWRLYDIVRRPDNLNFRYLAFDTSGEITASNTTDIDIYADGFKIKGSAGTLNGRMIYAARGLYPSGGQNTTPAPAR